MNRSSNWPASLLSKQSALQHERAPRPLPLFLEMVRSFADRNPDMARAALDGLAAYAKAERASPRNGRPAALTRGGATLRDHGGSGPPVVLIPSLINPPSVLDLDEEVSLASTIAGMGRHVLLLDWGAAAERSDLDVGGHVAHLLVPLIADLGEPAALVGYCLGGTMAIAAANLLPCERVATLAAPWHFSSYPQSARDALDTLWEQARGTSEALGALPMEVLQAAFWSLDPQRTVTKFAQFSILDPGSAKARRFVALEDWANEGEPLPVAAARELIEDLFRDDRPGKGLWQVGGQPVQQSVAVPRLHCMAQRDLIAPAATAPDGEQVEIRSGHVGMIVGSARSSLHEALAPFLSPPTRL